MGIGSLLAGMGTLGGDTGVSTLGRRTYRLVVDYITGRRGREVSKVFIISWIIWLAWSCSSLTENGGAGPVAGGRL